MRKLLIAAVVLHFIIANWHGATHQLVPVPLTAWQTAFVIIVITALPIIGAVLSFTRRQLLGARVIFWSMIASALFGLIYHFIVTSVDNVWCVPDGPLRTQFIISAVLVGLCEVFAAYCGWKAVRHLQREGKYA